MIINKEHELLNCSIAKLLSDNNITIQQFNNFVSNSTFPCDSFLKSHFLLSSEIKGKGFATLQTHAGRLAPVEYLVILL